jgi:hypothetical protein
LWITVSNGSEEFDAVRVRHIKVTNDTVDYVTVISEVLEALGGAGRSTNVELVTLPLKKLRHQTSQIGVVVHM